MRPAARSVAPPACMRLHLAALVRRGTPQNPSRKQASANHGVASLTGSLQCQRQGRRPVPPSCKSNTHYFPTTQGGPSLRGCSNAVQNFLLEFEDARVSRGYVQNFFCLMTETLSRDAIQVLRLGRSVLVRRAHAERGCFGSHPGARLPSFGAWTSLSR